MNAKCCREDSSGYIASKSMVARAVKKIRNSAERRLYVGNMDDASNGQTVKKQLRCAISSCFDKNNICCKECDIKSCRYKCNFIDQEVCEHQIR